MHTQAWIRQAVSTLQQANIEGDLYLECRLLLAHVTEQTVTQLVTDPTRSIEQCHLSLLERLLERRLHGEPIAYLLGTATFFSLTLQVNPTVLIPRSDTEPMVEWLLQQSLPENAQVLDLGCGSGAIALALKAQRPNWQVTAIDNTEEAIACTQANAKRLGCPVHTIHSNWFTHCEQSFHAIISNPPYIAPDRSELEQLDYEPAHALISPKSGLADLEHIATHAPKHLLTDGILCCEHGYDQAFAFQSLLKQKCYTTIESHQDWRGKSRFTSASRPCQ